MNLCRFLNEREWIYKKMHFNIIDINFGRTHIKVDALQMQTVVYNESQYTRLALFYLWNRPKFTKRNITQNRFFFFFCFICLNFFRKKNIFNFV